MDVPNAARVTGAWVAAPPPTGVRLVRGSAFHKAPGLSAATHTSGAIAEIACVMGLAERLAPSVECCRLQRSCVVPVMYSGLGRLGIGLTRLLCVWAWNIQAC